MKFDVYCPHCKKNVGQPRNPVPTVDIIIYDAKRGIVFIERKNPPQGWALPGGFVDYGEKVEDAAVREVFEETLLHVELVGLLGVYSDPKRDPRLHTMSTVFIAKSMKDVEPQGADDALQAKYYSLKKLPELLAFDHALIVADFLRWLGKDERNKTL